MCFRPRSLKNQSSGRVVDLLKKNKNQKKKKRKGENQCYLYEIYPSRGSATIFYLAAVRSRAFFSHSRLAHVEKHNEILGSMTLTHGSRRHRIC